LVRHRATKEPANEEAQGVFRECLQEGLLFSVRGQHGNVLRFVPPFCTTESQLDDAAAIIERALARYA
jgi:4-aminobutyrate aminotransferase-like enzyme